MFLILSLFTQAKRGKNEQRWKDVVVKGSMIYVCTPTLLPPTPLSCFAPLGHSGILLKKKKKILPLCFSYMYVSMCVLTCVPVSLRCQSVFEGRGALILVLMGWGGREIILKPCLWLESMVIMRKWRDTEEKNQSVVRLKVQIDCGWWLCHMAAATSVYFLQYQLPIPEGSDTNTHTCLHRHTQET